MTQRPLTQRLWRTQELAGHVETPSGLPHIQIRWGADHSCAPRLSAMPSSWASGGASGASLAAWVSGGW